EDGGRPRQVASTRPDRQAAELCADSCKAAGCWPPVPSQRGLRDLPARNVFYEALDDMKCPSGLRVADFGHSVPIGADRHSYFAAHLYKLRIRDSRYPWFGLPSTWRFKVDPSIDWCEYSVLMRHFRMRMSAPCPARSEFIDLPTWTACVAERRSTYCGRRMSRGGRKQEIYGNRAPVFA
ncbi:unnamed protein product, partial [Polarella glacialis]